MIKEYSFRQLLKIISSKLNEKCSTKDQLRDYAINKLPRSLSAVLSDQQLIMHTVIDHVSSYINLIVGSYNKSYRFSIYSPEHIVFAHESYERQLAVVNFELKIEIDDKVSIKAIMKKSRPKEPYIMIKSSDLDLPISVLLNKLRLKTEAEHHRILAKQYSINLRPRLKVGYRQIANIDAVKIDFINHKATFNGTLNNKALSICSSEIFCETNSNYFIPFSGKYELRKVIDLETRMIGEEDESFKNVSLQSIKNEAYEYTKKVYGMYPNESDWNTITAFRKEYTNTLIKIFSKHKLKVYPRFNDDLCGIIIEINNLIMGADEQMIKENYNKPIYEFMKFVIKDSRSKAIYKYTKDVFDIQNFDTFCSGLIPKKAYIITGTNQIKEVEIIAAEFRLMHSSKYSLNDLKEAKYKCYKIIVREPNTMNTYQLDINEVILDKGLAKYIQLHAKS